MFTQYWFLFNLKKKRVLKPPEIVKDNQIVVICIKLIKKKQFCKLYNTNMFLGWIQIQTWLKVETQRGT